MALPLIALVGGFLGAGKTTLILSASRILKERGLRVAAIMNDQDAGLVDTRVAEANHLATREVAGGCFCCRFSDLLEAADQLRAYQPDVIFAEPVGSCIDLSATIAQPLKAYHGCSYRLAPLTILFDPGLADQVYSGRADGNVEYLFRNQISEADMLCSTKADLYPDSLALSIPVDFSLSSKTGEGIEAWLDQVLACSRIAGSQVLQVDYARYADAEAALGWLNWHLQLELALAASPAAVVGPLLEHLERRLTDSGIRIAHLKIFDRAATGFIRASICGEGEPVQADGDLLADPALDHELAINLRAIGEPDQLQRIVSECAVGMGGKISILHQRSFRPAPPKPEHRFGGVFP